MSGQKGTGGRRAGTTAPNRKHGVTCGYPGCAERLTLEDFCFGCGSHVCLKHDPLTPMGAHKVKDHWEQRDA